MLHYGVRVESVGRWNNGNPNKVRVSQDHPGHGDGPDPVQGVDAVGAASR